MTNKVETIYRIRFRIRFADGSFVSSPVNERTTNASFAACFGTEEEAKSYATQLGGEVEGYYRKDGKLVVVAK